MASEETEYCGMGCDPMPEADTCDIACGGTPPESDDEDLDEEEEWSLEQIQLAYKRLHRTSQLAEYEKRRGLSELVEVYDRFCKELGCERSQNIDKVLSTGTTTEQLIAFRPEIERIVRVKSQREAAVLQHCRELTALWERHGHDVSTEEERDIVHAATWVPKRCGGGMGTLAMLPRTGPLGRATSVNVHTDSVQAITELLERWRLRDKVHAAPPIQSHTSHEDTVTGLWKEVSGLLGRLHLTPAHEYLRRMKEMAATGEPEVVPVLQNAREVAKAACEASERLSEGLKDLSMKMALFETYNDKAAKARERLKGKGGLLLQEEKERATLRREVHALLSDTLQALRTFEEDHGGIPFVPSGVVRQLFGLQDEESLQGWLSATLRRFAPPKKSNASASISVGT